MYVSEILQLIEIKYLLMVPGLCHFHGMMECWNIGFFLILKKNIICEINPACIEKTSIEVLKNSGSGKMPFPFMLWPINYFLTFHSNSRKLLPTASMPFIAFQEISQKAIVVAA